LEIGYWKFEIIIYFMDKLDCQCECHHEHKKTSSEWLMAFMVGMVAANLLFHFLPEMFEDGELSLWLVTAFLALGSLTQYVLHRFLQPGKNGNQFLWFLNLHNITDGLSIGLAWALKPEFGLSVAIGVLIHDIIHKGIAFRFLRRQGDSLGLAWIKIIATLISISAGFGLAYWLKPDQNLSIFGGAFAAGSLAFVAWLLIQEVFGQRPLVHFDKTKGRLVIYFIIGATAMILIFSVLERWFPGH